jgi:hypothetical protein
MERRTFLMSSGAALSDLATEWVAGSAAVLDQAHYGTPVPVKFIDWLENSTAQLAGMATDERQHVPGPLDAHLSTVARLITGGRYTPTVGRRLHRLVASLSQTIAWHRFDLGRHTHASQYWAAGLHHAHTARDHDNERRADIHHGLLALACSIICLRKLRFAARNGQ